LFFYCGLTWASAPRGVLFIYLAPFCVVVGGRWLLSDRFAGMQWLGLVLSFVGIAIAFGVPAPSADPRQIVGDVMMVGGAAAWAATTLVIKASALNRVSAEKTLLYQLVVSAPLLAVTAVAFGERLPTALSMSAIGSLLYQPGWV